MAILHISGKSSDLNDYSVLDDQGEEVARGEGYLPSIRQVCGGDYFDMNIDLITGQIVGWKPMTVDEAVKLVKGDEDEPEEY